MYLIFPSYMIFYKHEIYKHDQARIFQENKHGLSMAKLYFEKNKHKLSMVKLALRKIKGWIREKQGCTFGQFSEKSENWEKSFCINLNYIYIGFFLAGQKSYINTFFFIRSKMVANYKLGSNIRFPDTIFNILVIPC